jgi:hypothetical protein
MSFMKFRLQALAAAAAVAALIGVSTHAQIKTDLYHLRYNQGQVVQPIFEGWSRNADGSFAMLFGYLNRNFVEEVSIPIGAQNSFDQGPADRGQPTYFYPRINRRIFSVNVPKDFGKKELVWTLNFRGESLKAVGWLQPEWEAEAPKVPQPRGGNTPPTLSITPPARVQLPEPITLVAAVTDDGLPAPRAGGADAPARRQAVGQETPPILMPGNGTVEPPVNLPELRLNLRGARIAPRPPQGLSVGYTIWRAPAPIVMDPMFAVPKDGKASTKMTFTEPGEYVLRARATDGALYTEQEIKITVTGSRPSTSGQN